jgi:hypothetical protein
MNPWIQRSRFYEDIIFVERDRDNSSAVLFSLSNTLNTSFKRVREEC